MDKIIVAIDGGSGSGKSTTAKAVARALEYIYIDTGAMYRAVTLYFLQHKIDIRDDKAVQKALDNITIEIRFNTELNRNETYLNGRNVEDEIRGMEVSAMVSPVSELSSVRKKLVEQQREMGKRKGVVMDGRDIGTVVFPEAELKVFMSCNLDIRARRRQMELEQRNKHIPLEQVLENLRERDRIDSSRADSPLKRAKDAHHIDTSHLTIEEQVQRVLDLMNEVAAEKE
jgi:cytidylate kinase